MRIKKKDLNEIIDSNGELIGNKDTPTTGGDLETAANGTTDQNVGKGQQPFRYDMLGRFGMTKMPFMEGKEEAPSLNGKDVIQLMYEMYMKTIEYYYRHPNKLKSEFRILSEPEDDSPSEERTRIEDFWADAIVELIEPYFKNLAEPIDESIMVEDNVVEDKLVDKKSEEEISSKTEDKGVRDSKLEKIAGLIDKLDKESKDKLKNLLERKNG